MTFLVGAVLTVMALFGAAQSTDPRMAEMARGLIPLTEAENPDAAPQTIAARMAHYGVSGVAVGAIIEGEVVAASGFGTLVRGGERAVDEESVFSVGSVSKVVNAALILRLVADGKLDLDTDVNTYLTRWQVPENAFTADEKVTLRRILSHTAGLTVHGFPDFPPGSDLPTVIDTLEGRRPARTAPVRVVAVPGTVFDYSGGGVTISQLVVEEVTGLSYPAAAKAYVFDPLGMRRSTFENPLPEAHGNIAKAHNFFGFPVARPRGYQTMPEMAASGLWTSAEDLAIFVKSLMDAHEGRSDFLPDALMKDMMTRQPNSSHGLGPVVMGADGSLRFEHGGANNSYRAAIVGFPGWGDGMVVLTNGARGHLLVNEVRAAFRKAFGWN